MKSKSSYRRNLSSTTGGNEQDVQARLGKVRTVFRAMDKYRKSKITVRAIKIRIFNSNVKAVLQYGLPT